MKRLYSTLLSCVLALHAWTAAAENRLYIEDFSIDPGETVDVSIMLDNEVTDYASFQADMYLPEGLEIVEQYNEEDDEYITFALTSRKRSRMSIGSAVQSDGAIRMMLTQSTGNTIQTIQGTSGALVTFRLKAAENASGTKIIRLQNIYFTTATSEKSTFDNTQTTVTVSGSSEPENPTTGDRLYIEDFSIDPGEAVDVSIMLDNEVTDYASFQADMYLPEGLEIVEQYNEEDDEYITFALTSRKRSRMSIGSAVQSDGAIRMMLTQSTGNTIQTIQGTSGALVTFRLKAAENAFGIKIIRLQNIYFTTATSEKSTFDNTQTTVTVTANQPNVPSTGISLNNTTLSLTTEGETAVLTATVTPSDATDKSVTWESSNTSVATVSTTGVVTAVANGTAVITATTADGTNLSAQCTVTVSIKVEMIPGDANGNGDVTFADVVTVTDYILGWNPADFVFETANIVDDGKISITDAATIIDVVLNKKATKVTLSTSKILLENGTEQQLTATVLPKTATNKDISWSSSDENVATVDQNGLVTAVALGTCTITATVEDSQLSASCEVTITDHLYVDLGLPSGTLWATCNIGASSPEDFGDYFAWGETTGYNDGKTTFDWSTYKWCEGSSSTMTKYCTDSSYGYNGFTDDKTELDLEDDAAYVNWGPAWRMPSKEQFAELINSSYTTTTWTTQNGVYGRLITSKSNRNSIFLPAAGYRDNSSLYSADWFGDYWSRTLYESYPYSAGYLDFLSDDIYTGSYNRCRGRSVRPVRLSE